MILIRIASYSAFHPSNLINQEFRLRCTHIDQEQHMDDSCNINDITGAYQNFDSIFFFFFFFVKLPICYWMLF